MLCKLCITIIILNTYHTNIKVNHWCKADESKTVDINKVLASLKNYISTGASYVGSNLFKEKTRHTFRDDFIKNVERGLKVIKSPGKVNEIVNKVALDDVEKPKRKYKHFKSGLSAMQLIRSQGYKAETHKVTTYDGYMLTIQRIIPSTKALTNETVILHHGFLGSAEDWLLMGSGRALPYLLSDQGYDVWLLNARGNKYSRAHEHIDIDSFEFWDFSWHEMGTHDLPAVLTYISSCTEGANLYYIGHSMGGTALLVLLSTYPEYNQKLKLAVLLAPLVFMSQVNGPLKYFKEYRSETFFYIGYKQKQFIASDTFPQFIIDKYCQGSRTTCSNPLLLLSNGGKEISDPEIRHNVLTHVPAGGSSKTMIHYMQLIKSGRFQMFDYGMLNNIKNYKDQYPPKYNLSAINLPIMLFTSPSDWLSTVSDNSLLLTELRSVTANEVINNYDHFDFIWSKDATYLLYYIIIDILDDTALRKRMNTLVTTMI